MILIVEDDRHIRQLFAVNLQARGYAVQEAASGTEALEHIQAYVPDIMLLDIKLPDFTGWDLLAMLDGLHIPDFPVLVVTALSDPSGLPQPLNPRIRQIVRKPIAIPQLIEIIQYIQRSS